MLRLAGLSALCWLLLLTCSASGSSEKRVALIIGNSNYTHVSRLKNPRHDAEAIAGKLHSMGFDQVILKHDLDANALRQVLGKFSSVSAGAEIAMIYFAGHGIEVQGANYVIPTDARLSHVDDVDFEAMDLSRLMRSVSRAKKLKLVILDACRDNPFKGQMGGIGASRSVGRGLARVSPPNNNTLVAYAAREGTIAADGEAEHSPYAAALIKHIATRSLDIRLMFGRVRDEVVSATGSKQEPYTYGSLPGQQIFLATESGSSAGKSNALGRNREIIDRDALFWSSVKDSSNPNLLREYLNKFPKGMFASLANARLAKITKPEVKVIKPKAPAKRLAVVSTAIPQPKPAGVIRRGKNIAFEIQELLQLHGCNPGKADGVWGDLSKRALRQFAMLEGIALRSDAPTNSLLVSLKRRKSNICLAACRKRGVIENGQCVVLNCSHGFFRAPNGECRLDPWANHARTQTK